MNGKSATLRSKRDGTAKINEWMTSKDGMLPHQDLNIKCTGDLDTEVHFSIGKLGEEKSGKGDFDLNSSTEGKQGKYCEVGSVLREPYFNPRSQVIECTFPALAVA
jgi:hypothetical protein